MVSISHHPAHSGLQAIGTPVFRDVDQQRLRILRCTARAMAATPGGLRFSPGTRPWLDGLIPHQPVASAGGGARDDMALPAAADLDSKP